MDNALVIKTIKDRMLAEHPEVEVVDQIVGGVAGVRVAGVNPPRSHIQALTRVASETIASLYGGVAFIGPRSHLPDQPSSVLDEDTEPWMDR